MKYADRRNSPCVVIQGSNERERGEVQIKDLIEGAKAAAAIASNEEWKAARPAQISVQEIHMVAAVREILDRHGLVTLLSVPFTLPGERGCVRRCAFAKAGRNCGFYRVGSQG